MINRRVSMFYIVCVGMAVGLAGPAAGKDDAFPWPWSAAEGDDTVPSWNMDSDARSPEGDDSSSIADESNGPEIVHSVEYGKVDILKSNPPMLNLIALGSVTTGGWSDAALLPTHYVVPPSDGIYDFVFVATPPTGMAPQVMTKIAAHELFDAFPKDLKGVRIRAATNSLTITISEGESGTPKAVGTVSDSPADQEADPSEWVGKKLVRLGESNTGSEDAVYEAHLSQPYRIFTPEASLADSMYNPNRLNIFLDEDGIITAISWG